METKAFFLKRLNDHVQYLKRVKERLDGANNFEPTDCHTCALGHWLYGEGQQEVTSYGPKVVDLFNQLLEPHERFHTVSSEALQAKLAGDEVGMRRALTDMHKISNSLITILLQMDTLVSKSLKAAATQAVNSH